MSSKFWEGDDSSDAIDEPPTIAAGTGKKQSKPGKKPPPASNGAWLGWHANCQRDGKGNPLTNLVNAAIALEQDPTWTGRITRNEMLYETMVDGKPLDADTTIEIQEWMQRSGLRRVARETVADAIQFVSGKRRFNPLMEQTEALSWDGKQRADSWLTTYLGVPADAYSREVGVRFLIAMAARLYRPGCKADYMLVLEGEQGAAKSEVCRTLAGDDYFSDNLSDISGDTVRTSMHLRGKWLIEIADLHAFFSTRVDTAHLKEFITRRTEEYVPKYGRSKTIEHRRCLFIGTSNKENYLRDETGNRRFWPVKCGTIQIDAFKTDRDQIMAEAIHRYKAGEPWWPDRDFERLHITPQQAQRYQGDSWEALIEEWDRLDADRDSNGRPLYDDTHTPLPRVPVKGPPYTLLDIARGALHLDRLSKSEEMRLSATLESIGWNRATRTKRGVPWMPPALAAAQQSQRSMTEPNPEVGF